jgi:CheY-like chemotaxis protein
LSVAIRREDERHLAASGVENTVPVEDSRGKIPSVLSKQSSFQGLMESPFPEHYKPKVLVADDERLIADTLGMILNRSGFRASVVYDGIQAVETARSWQPDLLLTDVVMPAMNGVEAAIQICAMIPECRVLLFSGQAGTSDLLQEARARGYHFEVLPKPIPPSELLARLRSALSEGQPGQQSA